MAIDSQYEGCVFRRQFLGLRNGAAKRMSELMKNVRDIRLIGIGFVAGMVLCYFLTLESPKPPANATVTMTLAQASQPLPASQAAQAREESLVRYVNLFEIQEHERKLRDQPMRIVPARSLEGGNGTYDMIDLNYKLDLETRGNGLIDFNYVPDFKIPVE